MAEMTPFMSAAGTDGSGSGMVLFQDMVYHEVCDPNKYGRVSWGERGTPVYTHLERTSPVSYTHLTLPTNREV